MSRALDQVRARRRAGPDGGAPDRGATLVIVLVMVAVLSVAALSVVKLGFGAAGAEEVSGQDQRLTNALETAAAAGLDAIRAAGNTCPGAGSNPAWPLTLHDVDGLGRPPSPPPPPTPPSLPTVAPVDVVLECAASGAQLLLQATRVVHCVGSSVAPVSRLSLSVLLSPVGESAVPSLQVQQRNLDELSGCAVT